MVTPSTDVFAQILHRGQTNLQPSRHNVHTQGPHTVTSHTVHTQTPHTVHTQTPHTQSTHSQNTHTPHTVWTHTVPSPASDRQTSVNQLDMFAYTMSQSHYILKPLALKTGELQHVLGCMWFIRIHQRFTCGATTGTIPRRRRCQGQN